MTLHVCLPSTSSILRKLIDLLNNAEKEFQNQDVSSLIDGMLHKLGGLASYYINQYPTENCRGLASLNRFLSPQYVHYSSRKVENPINMQRNRVGARAPPPAWLLQSVDVRWGLVPASAPNNKPPPPTQEHTGSNEC